MRAAHASGWDSDQAAMLDGIVSAGIRRHPWLPFHGNGAASAQTAKEDKKGKTKKRTSGKGVNKTESEESDVD